MEIFVGYRREKAQRRAQNVVGSQWQKKAQTVRMLFVVGYEKRQNAECCCLQNSKGTKMDTECS